MTAVRQRPLAAQLDDVVDRLLRDHPELPAGTVHDVVDAVRAGFADATVLTYLPVLVEREVRARLGRPR